MGQLAPVSPNQGRTPYLFNPQTTIHCRFMRNSIIYLRTSQGSQYPSQISPSYEIILLKNLSTLGLLLIRLWFLCTSTLIQMENLQMMHISQGLPLQVISSMEIL